jgi:hypothetical protein
MNRIAMSGVWLAATACAMLASGVAFADKLPETWDGLVQRKSKGIDAVYVRPDVDFSVYRNVVLDPVVIAFDKNWKPNRAGSPSLRLSTSDIEKIREKMASGFQSIFAEELAAGGYAIVPKPLDDTLRVSAGLADVYITAPDTASAGRTRTYTQSAGRMTLVMELRDGPTGQLLARVVDRHADDSSIAQLSTSASNTAEFNRTVKGWAQRLVKGLDSVTGKTP